MAPDDLDFQGDDSGDEGLPEPQTAGVRKLRQAYEQSRNELSQVKQELEDRLREAEEKGAAAATRRIRAERTFEGLGFPKFADLWLERNEEGEVDEDAAKAFLTDLGITGGGSKPPTPPPVDELVKAHEFSSSTGPAESTTQGYIDREELDKLYRTNPRQAIEYLTSGRVRWKNLPNP